MWRSFLSLLGLLSLFALPAPAQVFTDLGDDFAPAGKVGTVVRVQGDAVANGVSNGMRMLQGGEEINSDDLLVTFQEARLEIELKDGTSFVMGQLGRFIFEDYRYMPGAKGNRARFNLLQGVFKMTAGAVAKESMDAFSVKTPVATIGIRGTEFWGGSIDGNFSVLALEGKVVVENAQGRVELTAGQGTNVPKDRAPEPPAVWTDEKKTRAFATVAFE